MDEGGLLRRATPEHVLSPVEGRMGEPGEANERGYGMRTKGRTGPRRISDWKGIVVDDMISFGADDVDDVPNSGPKLVDIISRPNVEILIRD